jgi:hypothetical protein
MIIYASHFNTHFWRTLSGIHLSGERERERERERVRASSQEQLEPSKEFLASERERELLGNCRLIILW